MAKRRPAWLIGLLAIILAAAISVSASGPRLILVDGTLLERPTVLGNWDDNLRLMAAMANPTEVSSDALANRPYYRFALFWGAEWAEYMNEGGSASALKPEQANQHARFYPAVGTAQALFVIESQPGPARGAGLVRSINQQGLDLLAKYGLRVRVAPTSQR